MDADADRCERCGQMQQIRIDPDRCREITDADLCIQMQTDANRSGQIRTDVDRCGQMRRDAIDVERCNRCGEMRQMRQMKTDVDRCESHHAIDATDTD